MGLSGGDTGGTSGGFEATARLLNDGGSVDVVSAGNCQAALNRIAVGRTEDGHDLQTLAFLVPEPDNEFDSNAIHVQIDKMKVGYLSPLDAEDYQPVVGELMSDGNIGAVIATIQGGWRRGKDDEGHYGVVLDLAPAENALEDPSDGAADFFEGFLAKGPATVTPGKASAAPADELHGREATAASAEPSSGSQTRLGCIGQVAFAAIAVAVVLYVLWILMGL